MFDRYGSSSGVGSRDGGAGDGGRQRSLGTAELVRRLGLSAGPRSARGLRRLSRLTSCGGRSASHADEGSPLIWQRGLTTRRSEHVLESRPSGPHCRAVHSSLGAPSGTPVPAARVVSRPLVETSHGIRRSQRVTAGTPGLPGALDALLLEVPLSQGDRRRSHRCDGGAERGQSVEPLHDPPMALGGKFARSSPRDSASAIGPKH